MKVSTAFSRRLDGATNLLAEVHLKVLQVIKVQGCPVSKGRLLTGYEMHFCCPLRLRIFHLLYLEDSRPSHLLFLSILNLDFHQSTRLHVVPGHLGQPFGVFVWSSFHCMLHSGRFGRLTKSLQSSSVPPPVKKLSRNSSISWALMSTAAIFGWVFIEVIPDLTQSCPPGWAPLGPPGGLNQQLKRCLVNTCSSCMLMLTHGTYLYKYM